MKTVGTKRIASKMRFMIVKASTYYLSSQVDVIKLGH
jgi:hypothetical protein